MLPVGYFTMVAGIFSLAAYSEDVHWGHPSPWRSLVFAVVVLVLGLGYVGLGLMGGIGLLRGDEWGRKLSLVHAAASLVLIPLGTVIGALSLRYLTRDEVKEIVAARKRPAQEP